MNVKGIFINLGVLLVSIVGTALLIEWGLRTADYDNQLPYVNYLGRQQIRTALPGVPYLYPAHASFGQVWPSNPRGYFDAETNGVSYALNNYGFRDENFSIERNEKTRIAFLGDSFCWGNGVRGEDTFASLLETRLNAANPSGPGYEVYNFCLAGYSTQHEAALYDHVVRHFRPDILIVWYFLNDVNIPPALYFDWKQQVGGEWLREARRKWRLLDLAVAPLNRFQNHQRLVQGTQAAYEEGHPGYDSIVRGFDRMRRANDEDGVRSFLAIFPWLYRLDSDRYPFKKAHQTVRGLAEQEGFTVLDLLPVYAGIAAQDLWVYSTDQHPNERAHAMAADAMFELLRAELEEPAVRPLRNRRQIPPPPETPGSDWWAQFATPPSAPAVEPSATRPNVLFILADDLGYADLGAYGGTEISTPNIDRLAAEGMRFTQFYSNGAVCTPTRLALLTGRYPQRFGFREGLKSASSRGLDGAVMTLPSLLQEAGYDTMHVGKWHVGHAHEELRPLAKGYHRFFGFLHAWFLDRTYLDPMLQRDEQEAQRSSGHMTDLFTDEMVAFLKSRKPSAPPFYLSFWPYNPHAPFEPPPRWAARYEDTREGRYGALVSTLDENIGRLLDALEEVGLAEETIFVFASDNGGVGKPFLPRTHNGPFRGVKNFFEEGGVRVPLIVRWPGQVEAGAVRDDLIVSHDYLPTLAELLEVQIPAEKLDGRSLAKLLRGGAVPAFEGPIFWEDYHVDSYRFAVRERRWKLLVSEGTAHLFDLAEDPGERRDLAAEHPDVVRKMTNKYHRWRLETAEIAYDINSTVGEAHFEGDVLTLAGKGGAARIDDQAMFDPGDGEFSFVTWLCPDADAPMDGAGVIARKGSGWSFALSERGKLRVDAKGVVVESRTALPAESCSHLAFTFFHPGLHLRSTETGRLRLYLDAELQGEATIPGALTPNDEDVYLGRDASGAEPLFGRLMGVSFYNTALTAQELRGLFEQGTSVELASPPG